MSLEGPFGAPNLNKEQSTDVTKKESNSRSKTFEEYLPRALTLFENLKPESFGPRWIYTNNAYLYNRLVALLPKDEGGRADWQYFVDKLPQEWQEKWQANENLGFNFCISKVSLLLENLKPENFGPAWIQKNDPSVYQKLRTVLLPRKTKDRSIDWQYFTSHLPQEWQEKWEDPKNIVRNENLSDTISRAESILNSTNPKPKKIGPIWFYKNSPALHQKLLISLPKKPTGAVDWDFFIEKLSKDWQKKWKQRGRYGYHDEIKEYSNEEELESALRPFKDKLYLIPYYSNLDKNEDKKSANMTIDVIAMLAQKGSSNARELLEKDLLMVFEDWVDKYPELQPWKNAIGELKSQIKNIIYNYQGQRNFFGYAFITLKRAAKKFPETKRFEDNWMKSKNNEDDI